MNKAHQEAWKHCRIDCPHGLTIQVKRTQTQYEVGDPEAKKQKAAQVTMRPKNSGRCRAVSVRFGVRPVAPRWVLVDLDLDVQVDVDSVEYGVVV